MKYILLLLCLTLLPTTGFCKFGGGRSSSSSSSSSSSRSSSFGGSRSSPSPSSTSSTYSSFGGNRSSGSTPATISRPSPSVSPSNSYQPSNTTVVVHDNSGSGFWSGWFMASAMNNSNRPVVVNNVYDSNGQLMQQQTQVVDNGHGFFYYLFLFIFIGALIFVGMAVLGILGG